MNGVGCPGPDHSGEQDLSTQALDDGLKFAYLDKDGFRCEPLYKREGALKDGIICIGYRNDTRKDRKNRRILYAVALCSPKDQFKKKTAKELIVSRVSDGDYITIDINNNERVTNKEAVWVILHNLRYFATPNQLGLEASIPKWTRYMLSNYLCP